MSPRQRADDAGRQMRQPWLGAKGARWPMDWEYREWALAGATLVLGSVLLIFVIPAVVGAVLLTRWSARIIATRTESRRNYWVVIGCMGALCGLISPNPITWLRPIFWPVAVLIALILPFRAVKHFGPHLNWNRPIMYWVTLPFKVAAGPRRPQPQRIDVSQFETNLTDTETGPIEPNRVIVIGRAKTPAAKNAKRKRERTVKATITTAPTRHVRKRPKVGNMKPAKNIYRVPGGIVIYGTEFRKGY